MNGLRQLFAAWLLLTCANGGAQNARFSGLVRDAVSLAPVTNAQVKIEGAALAGRENSQIIRRVNAQGRFQLDVPPGNFDLWVGAPEHEETKLTLNLAA